MTPNRKASLSTPNPPLSSLPPSLLHPPRGSSCPGVDLLYSALLAAGGSRAGGPPDIPLVTTPPPVLLPFNSYTPHFISSIHENRPPKVREVHPLPDLSVHRGGVGGGNFHVVLHSHPTLRPRGEDSKQKISQTC